MLTPYLLDFGSRHSLFSHYSEERKGSFIIELQDPDIVVEVRPDFARF
jgi:hypothetical protein